jgi:aspartate kinase
MKSGKRVLLKFGGTSVGGGQVIRDVISIIASYPDEVVGVVFSAMSKTTDRLLGSVKLAAARKDYQPLFDEIKKQHLHAVDFLLATPILQQESPNKKQKVEEVDLRKVVENMFQEIEGLLRGVSLIGEASPRFFQNCSSHC